ncbi:hypothetical protein H5V45_00025 [Nocardioides sp. KIGAM211]|uniref:Uncharacterized protein n=1 Tax=Nocardioides luti TaxID=2761101 RepID=A0A7X0V993_9ACTN|nr:hypothetical protein [Nocardioides luti]MBB6625692.1 hypothetical protein [Nocardioides luti]
MSETDHADEQYDGSDPSPAPEPVRTGVDRVDTVIAAVEALEERPIEEHVGVFESAHDHLRRALDHQPADPA